MTDQATWFVVPFVTVAKIRRVDPGITLNPKSGCVILTEMEGVLEVTGGGVVVTGGGTVAIGGGVVVIGGGVVDVFTVRTTGLETPAA